MKRMLFCLLLCMTVKVVLGPEIATAQITYENVFVHASSDGRGLLRARGTQCFAITPRHVVGPDASEISLIARDARRAKVGQVQYLSDFAVVEVFGLGEDACAEWPVTDGRSKLIASAIDATIVGLTEAGNVELVRVNITDKASLSFGVKPQDSADKITQGFSGSAVQIDGAVAGILMEVKDGRGVVRRIDSVEKIMEDFFAEVVPSTSTCTIVAPSHRETDKPDFALRVYVNDEYKGEIQVMPYSGDELEFDCSEGPHSYRLTSALAGFTGSCEGSFEVFGRREYVVSVLVSRNKITECDLSPI